MKLEKIYAGNIKSMNQTPCKIAIFSDGKNIKVLQKEYFNIYGLVNWHRNIIFEAYKNIKDIEKYLLQNNFKEVIKNV